ncbi:MAG: hypothetical protein AB1758_17940, partial [Candidatus Eremiobacterota bacterium]
MSTPSAEPIIESPPEPKVRVSWRTRLRRGASIAWGFFPIAPAGLLLLALSGYALYYHGLEKVDLLLLMMGGIGVAVTAVMLLAVLGAALLLFLQIRKVARPELRMVLDGQVWQPTGFELPFPGWFPCVDVSWRWETEPGRPMDIDVRLERLGGRALELVRPRRRCIYRSVRRCVTVRDVLRLCSLTWGWTTPCEVQMLPAAGHIDGL